MITTLGQFSLSSVFLADQKPIVCRSDLAETTLTFVSYYNTFEISKPTTQPSVNVDIVYCNIWVARLSNGCFNRELKVHSIFNLFLLLPSQDMHVLLQFLVFSSQKFFKKRRQFKVQRYKYCSIYTLGTTVLTTLSLKKDPGLAWLRTNQILGGTK